jgi:hypothetical protein
MELRRRQFLQFAGFAVATPAASRIANAQTYPTRPITIMVGGAAGGPTSFSGSQCDLVQERGAKGVADAAFHLGDGLDRSPSGFPKRS